MASVVQILTLFVVRFLLRLVKAIPLLFEMIMNEKNIKIQPEV